MLEESMREGVRKTRSDKKPRVNPSLNPSDHNLLKKLSTACEQPKTQMAALLIEYALQQPEIVNHFQKKFQADEYRIIPVRSSSGRVEYLVPR